MSMFIPELLLQKYIQDFVVLIKESINANLADNLITYMFDGVPVVGSLDYKKEALAIFRKETNPFTLRVGFNIGSAQELPIVLISLPKEECISQNIGLDSGEDVNVATTASGSIIRVDEIQEMYKSNYSINIVTANADTTVILSNVLKWMFLYRHFEVEADGFANFKVHSQDVIQDPQQAPPTIYVRSLVVEFTYEFNVKPSHYNPEVGKSAVFGEAPEYIDTDQPGMPTQPLQP